MTDEEVQEMIDEADRNGDGEVSLDDFARYTLHLNNHPPQMKHKITAVLLISSQMNSVAHPLKKLQCESIGILQFISNCTDGKEM